MRAIGMQKIAAHLRAQVGRLPADTRGVAAIEFLMIAPLMLMLCFGIIQVSSGLTVDRKVSQTARTLSDLISQSSSITDTDISNAFTTGLAMMSPYAAGPLQEKISQVYVDPVSMTGKVKWSRASGTGIAPHACNEVVPVPPALLVSGTYLIFSEVWYDFVPAFGHDINLNFVAPTFHLSDQMFTRPRQSLSVAYPTAAVCN
jgi:Flp pilus assembly protein TadG